MTIPKLLTAACLIAAVAAGSFTGYVDLHNSEVQPAVALLLGSALLLSVAQPRLAWLVALLLGLSIPVAHLWATTTGFLPPYPTTLPATFLALIPAFLGALLGIGIRKGWSTFRSAQA